MKISIALSLLSGLVVAGSACVKPKSSSTKDVLPFKVGDLEPKLGSGYDSLVQELRNTPNCVTGTSSKLSSAGASIDLGQNTESDRIMKEFSGEVKGAPKIVFLEAGAAAGFFRSINKNSSAVNIVYAVKIEGGGEKLSDVSLSEPLKALAPAALYNACGDEYVVQINRGGLLTITLSLDFASEENRKKWQSQLKLAGSWADVSSDLTRKMEDAGIDGTLTVKVNQLGGAPAQSLMAVRSCSMSTIEEFNACKQRVDDLMTYASNAFPQQIESNPAILNYVTSPLQALGATGLPSLPTEILEIRQDLAQMSQGTFAQSEMVTRAKEIGLEMDTKTVGDIAFNLDLIKLAAKACFNYKLAGESLDWSGCRTQKQELTTKLRKINATIATLNELSVPADSEIGQSIMNPYATKMSIVYSVSKQNTWSFDATSKVNFEGLNASDGKSSLSNLSMMSGEKRGALLVRSFSNLQKSAVSGSLDIMPGEAVSFAMNDIIGQFADNLGFQSVYWRCTNCTESMKKLPTYRLRVKASDDVGAAFRNQENLRGSFRMVAYGRWRASPSWESSDAAGISKTCGRKCPAPEAKFQTLVMKGSSPGTIEIGREKTMSISPGEPLYFLMNEEEGGYKDNQGEMEVIIQCQKCDIKSHMITIDPEDEE